MSQIPFPRMAFRFYVFLFLSLAVNSSYAQLNADMNADGAVDTRDIETLCDHLIGRAVAPGPVDYNEDEQVDIADLVGLISFINSYPPGPVELATPLDPTVPSDLYIDTQFLYRGPGPLQGGVPPGAIDQRRVAVIRGRVSDSSGLPLAGVTISILNHPEFGSTVSRLDGLYDMVVNGGGPLGVEYNKAGYLPVHRRIEVPWQDYVWAPDVCLTPLDQRVTSINLNAAAQSQIHEGTQSNDEDGTRQARLLFPPGVKGALVMVDDTATTLTQAHVRATEFTVGPNGPQAMPAELPPNVAYTYCVEYSLDEAMSSGAARAQFTQPLIHYNENFLSFPIGTIVPVGSYDRARGEWVPSDNGRVIKILGVEGGLALIDATGSDTPSTPTTLTELGITNEERTELASLYLPGTSLWRVPITHFTPFDCNWPFVPAEDARQPDEDAWRRLKKNRDCEERGSIIEVQNQDLIQQIPLVGTEFALCYASDRTSWRNRRLQIPVATDPPASLAGADLEVFVAGQTHKYSFPGAAGQSKVFEWDGQDAYGRAMQGPQVLSARLTWWFPGHYAQSTAESARAFAAFGASDAILSGSREQIGLRQSLTGLSIGGLNALDLGLGGWTLDVHHVFFPQAGTLYTGDGRQRVFASYEPVVKSIAPHGCEYFAFGQDGSIYFYDFFNPAFRRRHPDGTVQFLSFVSSGYMTNLTTGLVVASDGTLYWSERDARLVRRRLPGGRVETFAGRRTGSNVILEGVPATQTMIEQPYGLAIGPDGSVYICLHDRVAKVSPDGIINTVAGGNGTTGNLGDGGPARDAVLVFPQRIAIAPDGSIVIADGQQYGSSSRLRRVGPDGIIETIAGGELWGYSGDGGPAVDAAINVADVEVGPDGTIWMHQTALPYQGVTSYIRAIDPNGIIRRIAGGGTVPPLTSDGFPAMQIDSSTLLGIALHPDGSLCFSNIASYGDGRIHRISNPSPIASGNELLVASEDGSQVYVFDLRGRHLRTVDALTGAVLYRFSYNPEGLLIAVEDVDGLRTRIQRDNAGGLQAFIGPYGHVTHLALDGEGRLASITDPAGAETDFTYSTHGQLASLRNPLGEAWAFRYDEWGDLVEHEDPLQHTLTLDGETARDSKTTLLTSAEGRLTSYTIEYLPGGDERRDVDFGDGGLTTTMMEADVRRTTTLADGMIITQQATSDARWGMQAPWLQALTVKTREGLTLGASQSQAVLLSDPADPLSLRATTETLTVNGDTYTRAYNEATNQITFISPLGRLSQYDLDERARVKRAQLSPDLATYEFFYDPQGRLIGVRWEDNATSLTYDQEGRIASIRDPLGHVAFYEYDAADRLTKASLPGGRAHGYGYNAAGQLTRITMPNGALHEIEYDQRGLVSGYRPPENQNKSYQFAYDGDGKLSGITMPSGGTIGLELDATGRLTELSHADGRVTMSYNGTQGGCCGGGVRPTSVVRTAVGTTASQAMTFEYDGPLVTGVTWEGEVQAAYSYRYDAKLMLTGMSFGSDPEVSLSRDAEGELIGIGPFVMTRGGPGGSPSQVTDGTLLVAYAYDQYGNMTSQRIEVGGQPVFSIQLERDATGDIVTREMSIDEETTRTWTYQYNALGMLEEVRREGILVEQYQYDVNGNRLSTLAGVATYDSQDRLQAREGVNYAIGEDGFVTGRGTDQFTYSATGELLEAHVGGQTVTYQYDGWGRRVTRKDSSGPTWYVYGWPDQPFRPTATRDSAGVWTRYYYDEKAIVFAMQRGTDWYYVATDFVGTPLAVFDATGRAVKVLEYDSYGVLLSDSNPSFELAVGFAGGLADEQTGLVRFGWRDYEPAAGRWTARDPLFFAGGYGNLYTYCANDPVNHIDPSGQLWYDKISDLLAGFGDTITTIPFTDWSLTRYLRKKIEVDDVVNPCSNQYKGGRFFGKVYKAAQWWNRINAFRAPLYPSAHIPQVPLGLRP